MKEMWFSEFEKQWDRREAGEIEATDDELADMATEAMIDRYAGMVDEAHEWAKYEKPRAVSSDDGSREEA